MPKHDDILQMYFAEIATNPESNQPLDDLWTCSQNDLRLGGSDHQCSACANMQQNPTVFHPEPHGGGGGGGDDHHQHVYAVPARIRAASSDDSGQRSIGSLVSLHGDDNASSTTLIGAANDDSENDPVLTRIKKDCELKEEFLRRPNPPGYLLPTAISPPPYYSPPGSKHPLTPGYVRKSSSNSRTEVDARIGKFLTSRSFLFTLFLS